MKDIHSSLLLSSQRNVLFFPIPDWSGTGLEGEKVNEKVNFSLFFALLKKKKVIYAKYP